MNKNIRHTAWKLVHKKIVWSLLSPVVKVSNHLQQLRNNTTFTDLHDHYQRFRQILKTPVVKNGPFTGMKYPGFSSFGSVIFPKILGSYEKELTHIIEEVCHQPYNHVLDIGSAEGYYAIGLALRIPQTKVYAYDINEQANNACRQMAELNGVHNRIFIEKECSAETLKAFDFGERSLIICDCEGYEKELFSVGNVSNLTKCDLLIEVHDFVDLNISGHLQKVFIHTHELTSVKSTDDIAKVREYQYEELNGLSLEDRFLFLQESRPYIMEWQYWKAKKLA